MKPRGTPWLENSSEYKHYVLSTLLHVVVVTEDCEARETLRDMSVRMKYSSGARKVDVRGLGN
jgi:hypothetical protein